MEKLKDIYQKEVLQQIAEDFKTLHKSFDVEWFMKEVYEHPSWEELALRQRMKHIAKTIYEQLDMKYENILPLIVQYSTKHHGFPYLFLPDIIDQFGQDHLELSLSALKELTKSSTGEFAIRSFLTTDYETTIQRLQQYSLDDNEHVRRFASEGSRMRLPWGMSVKALIEHPDDVIKILTVLKTDESEYVRKSVANNLNDMSRYHPELVNDLFEEWLKDDNPFTNWIIKRGARTLIKQGNARTLALLGYEHQNIIAEVISFNINNKHIHMGDISEINYKVKVKTDKKTNIKLNLIIGFMKANGSISKKTFHLQDCKLIGEDIIQGVKSYEWKNMTTRIHYAGQHNFALSLNGNILIEIDATLLPPSK